MSNEISINKAILHVLDTNAGIPVLSDMLLNMTVLVKEYVEKHVQKSIKDPEIKRTVFRSQSKFKDRILDYQKNSHELVRVSQEISQLFFDYMVDNINIPSADLVFVDFDLDNEKHLGIFKFNYKQGYIHYVNTDKGLSNDILVQPCVLPTERQKLDEFVIFNLTSYQILLKEKQFLIDDKKEFYISTQLIFCEDSISEKAAFEIVEKNAIKIVENEYGNDVDKLNAIKRTMAEDIEASSTIDVENIAEVVFYDSENVQEQFKQEISNNGINENFQVSENFQKKVSKKQKFLTDSGVEISIPYDHLMRNDIVEFNNNLDGSITVIIKNIGRLTQK